MAAKATWGNNDFVVMNIRGSSMNPDLFLKTPPLAHARAWVALYKMPYSNSTSSILNNIVWLKGFEHNQDLTAVVTLDFNTEELTTKNNLDYDFSTSAKESFAPLFCLVDSVSGTKYLVVIDNQNFGKTVRQY